MDLADPLALSVRGDPKTPVRENTAALLAAGTASEIEIALSERLKPPSVYELRWIE